MMMMMKMKMKMEMMDMMKKDEIEKKGGRARQLNR